ncbi:MAG: hypothetical protein K9N49_04515 [Candidatus Marinimicrobia bacterium]|nr:hypothetical protein [Candidatus Neomarinimicrobiota bacterium]
MKTYTRFIILVILGAAAHAGEVLDMQYRQLMLDEAVVAASQNVERFYGQFAHSGVRVLEPTEPIETVWNRISGGPIVIHDEAAGVYRMWYNTVWRVRGEQFGLTRAPGLYAESADAVHWTKPALRHYEFEDDSGANNIVYGMGFDSVTRDPGAECRYRAFKGHQFVMHTLSNDGRSVAETVSMGFDKMAIPNAKEKLEATGVFNADRSNVSYDPVTGRYLGMFKTWTQLEGGRDSEAWRRSVALAVSGTGTDWTFSGDILTVDLADDDWLHGHPHVAAPEQRNAADPPPRSELHDMGVFRYEGLLLGIRNHMYVYPVAGNNRRGHEAGRFGQHSTEQFLTWSRDFEIWQRPPSAERRPLFPVPPVDSPHFGFRELRYPCILEVGDELWLFHNVPEGMGNELRPPRPTWFTYATLRLDGWAGYRAGAEEGWIETAPFRADGALRVNVDAEGGALRVAVLDEQGHEIPGFGREQSRPVTGDHTAAEVQWNQAAWDDLAGRTVQLKFYLHGAAVYSFWTRER